VTEANPGTIQLTLVRFSRPERSQWLARSAALLSGAELERIAAITDPDTRTRHALGRALLRLMAASAAGTSPLDLEVAVTETGKPWLPGHPDLHVNVSHTRRAVVAASASVAPIGVDIEHPAGTTVQPQRLAQRLFASAEVRTLGELPDDGLADWFSSAWTIKEAVAKALGIGVIPALSEVVVERGDDGLKLAAVGVGPPAESWTLHQLVAPGGSEKIAVAVPAPDVELESVSVLTLQSFARAVELQNAAQRQGATERTWSGSARLRART
jgi:phosphopantetheinyl transferase